MIKPDNKHNPKAKYTSPQIIKFGTISELTQGAPNPTPDGSGGSGIGGFTSGPPILGN